MTDSIKKQELDMIQDIQPHEYQNAYEPMPPEKDSCILYYEGTKCLVKKEEKTLCYPTFGELETDEPDVYDQAVYLFSVDGIRFYLVEKIEEKIIASYEMIDKENFRERKPKYLAFAGITGYQLYLWYRQNRFCGACGHPMEQDQKERMVFCPQCGNMVYPHLSPAVIVGILNGDKILLSRYANKEFKRYALIAGFAEIGETLEETVRREVREEVGLEVKNICYYKSQPWSFTGTLLAGFYCELDGSDTITLQEDELSMAGWYRREEIPMRPNQITLTNEMVMRFKNGQEKIGREAEKGGAGRADEANGTEKADSI